MADITREEVDGLGRRLNETEKVSAVHTEAIRLNEKTVDEAWVAINGIRADIKSLLWKIGIIVGVLSYVGTNIQNWVN